MQIDQIEQERIGGAFQICTTKTIYLFDSFELLGWKKIIVQDDKKIINKILFGLEKTKLTDNNLTLVQTNEKAIKQTKCKG